MSRFTFNRKTVGRPASEQFQARIKRLVGEARDRPISILPEVADVAGEDLDVMTVLVELRTAGKRGNESTAAHKLGPEFTRYLSEFYSLPPDRQPQAIEALQASRRQEQQGDLAAAVQSCETGLRGCPAYLPLLERLARLEAARGETAAAERWYSQVLAELDRLEYTTNATDICRRLVEIGMSDPELLERCAHRLEAVGDLALAARCWSRRAANTVAAGRPAEALPELDRALALQPHDAALFLELALVYERLEEVDRATAAFEQAAALATDDPHTLSRLLLIRAGVSRPDDTLLGRLMDLVEERPETRAAVLERCDDAVVMHPYNPHLRYLQGVLLAQDGRLADGIGALRIAIDRYAVQSDRASELEARLALQPLTPRDEDNRRRIAALHFERGEVHLAMQALAGLARVARGTAAG